MIFPETSTSHNESTGFPASRTPLRLRFVILSKDLIDMDKDTDVQRNKEAQSILKRNT